MLRVARCDEQVDGEARGTRDERSAVTPTTGSRKASTRPKRGTTLSQPEWGNMRCSKCGSDNREGRKFCTTCGTALVASCPKCGAPIQLGESFCGECGSSLSMPLTFSAPSKGQVRLSDVVPPEEVVDGERKTVTALFADIKGSMDLMEDLDPEEARAIVDPALKLMIDAVHRYDGYIVQSTGDGIFALFGAPIA